jgi:hypothetical protein
VIPGTLLGALFLASCLVPGFVFVRVAERRQAQTTRSALEAVELAGVGAATSLAAAMVVLGLTAQWWGILDSRALADDPGTYLLLHPFRGFGPLLATFALSCLLAWLAAQAVFIRHESVFEPGGSAWARVLWDDLPSSKHRVLLTVELKDGRRVIGVARSFTFEFADNRELALSRPLAVQLRADKPLIDSDDDFIVLRENEIESIAGRYVGVSSASEKSGPTSTPER